MSKRPRSQKRPKQRAIVVCIVVCTLAASCFLYFGTDLFSTQEDAGYTITLLEPVNDSLSGKEKFDDSLHLPAKRVWIQKKTPGENVRLEDTTKTAITTKDDKTQAFRKTEGTKRLTALPDAKKRSKKTAYEVVSVAHFYNRPSEKTRRKEAINYWNQAYASIKPVNEKNGFVFVVFKYPSGQRSEGWLRKKDLKKVNAAYENNKE